MDGKTILMIKACDLCGNECISHFSSGFEWLKCSSCKSIKFISVSGEKFEYSGETSKYKASNRVNLRWGHKKSLNFIKQTPRTNLVEIGCGTGEFTYKASRYSSNITGIDINSDSIEVAKKRFPKLSFFTEFPESSNLTKTVILIDCLEHFEDINAAIQSIFKMGSVDRIIISSPNVEKSFFDRTDYPPHHYYRFSIRGLEIFMKKYKYKLVFSEIEYSFDLLFFNYLGCKLNQNLTTYYGRGVSTDSNIFLKIISGVIRPILKIFNPILRFINFPHSSFLVVFEKNE